MKSIEANTTFKCNEIAVQMLCLKGNTLIKKIVKRMEYMNTCITQDLLELIVPTAIKWDQLLPATWKWPYGVETDPTVSPVWNEVSSPYLHPSLQGLTFNHEPWHPLYSIVSICVLPILGYQSQAWVCWAETLQLQPFPPDTWHLWKESFCFWCLLTPVILEFQTSTGHVVDPYCNSIIGDFVSKLLLFFFLCFKLHFWSLPLPSFRELS